MEKIIVILIYACIVSVLCVPLFFYHVLANFVDFEALIQYQSHQSDVAARNTLPVV